MTELTDGHKGYEFGIADLLRIMERLRDPSDGCPGTQSKPLPVSSLIL